MEENFKPEKFGSRRINDFLDALLKLKVQRARK
jgi:hypothetical protein